MTGWKVTSLDNALGDGLGRVLQDGSGRGVMYAKIMYFLADRQRKDF